MLHAGWRGLADGVIAAGVGALRGARADEVARRDRARRRAVLLRGRRRGPRARFGTRAGARSTSRRSPASGSRPRASAPSTTAGLCTIVRPSAVLLPPPRPRRHRAPGGGRVAELIRGLDAERVRANLERVREEIARRRARPGRRRDPRRGQVRRRSRSSASLAEAGIAARGREPRAGPRGQGARPRRRADVGLHRPPAEPQGQAGRCRSCATSTRSRRDSVARAARAPRARRDRGPRRGQRRRRGGKSGVAPADLDASSSAARRASSGLMTMPPLAADPEDSRRWFAALRELAGRARAARPSWARPRTTLVAVQEGATIVRHRHEAVR